MKILEEKLNIVNVTAFLTVYLKIVDGKNIHYRCLILNCCLMLFILYILRFDIDFTSISDAVFERKQFCGLIFHSPLHR